MLELAVLGRTSRALAGVAAALALAGAAAASPLPSGTSRGDVPQGAAERFTAERIGQGVLLRWIPAADAKTRGYNVYRAVAGARVRVNDGLIAAAPGLPRHAYRWLDRTSQHRARYWLQAVLHDGTSAWRGEATAS